jgi:hypothetical protein
MSSEVPAHGELKVTVPTPLDSQPLGLHLELTLPLDALLPLLRGLLPAGVSVNSVALKSADAKNLVLAVDGTYQLP